MSNDAGGGAPKKLTTQEILAAARAQAKQKAEAAAAASAPAEAAPVDSAPAAPATPETPVTATDAPAAPAAPAKKPTSTAEILAAARAQAAAKAAAAGGAAPAAAAPAPKPAGDKPKSTADILAAARAQAAAKAAGGAAGGAATASSAPAAADAPAAKPAKAAVAAGPKPSVQEMLAAVRGDTAATAVAAAPAAKVLPPAPVRPAPPAPKAAKAAQADRRSFLAIALSPVVLGWVSFTAAASAATLGTLRFMLPNVLTEPPSKFKVGPPNDYDLGTVSEKWKASNGIWIVHTDKYQGRNMVYALASVCTHLGCTPSWLDGEQKFKCPCHGSGFYITGINFEGPAPRPLERVGIRLAEDGMLEVDKSVKFQEEMGQWADPASYVEIA